MSTRLHVCHVTNAGGYGRVQQGGAERGVAELVASLDRRRYEVTLVCPRSAIEWFEWIPDLRILEAGPLYWLDPKYIVRLFGIFRRNRFDVVHVHLLSAATHGRIAARLAGVKVVVSDLHNSLPALREIERPSAFRRIRLGFYEKVDSVLSNNLTTVCIAISEPVRNAMVAQGVSRGRFRTIYNWIDEAKFRCPSATERSDARRALGLDRFTLCVAGRLESQKGIDLLLDALAKVSVPWHLVVCGTGSLASDLAQQANRLQLADNVRWLGRRSDLPAVLGAVDLVCVPSRAEGFGGLPLRLSRSGRPYSPTRSTVWPTCCPGCLELASSIHPPRRGPSPSRSRTASATTSTETGSPARLGSAFL